MPAHQNKHGIESIVAQQVEEWALKFQTHYDEKLHSVHREQKETLAIVNRLGKYVNNLEFKVNNITTTMKNVKNVSNENGDHDFSSDINNYYSPGKNNNSNGNSDLANRISMLEAFCGYDPEREAYAALGLGTGELLLPQHKLSNRLDKLETTLTKIDRNLREVEHEVGDLGPEKNNNSSKNNNYHNSGNGGLAMGLFFPEKARPKSTHGDPRHRSNTQSATRDRDSNNTPYTTPHPPAHTGTFGYRSAPSTKSRAVSRPTSAPHGTHGNTTHSQKGQVLQKMMDDVKSQIEEVDEKNNMQNTFVMNEMMQNFHSQEEVTDRKLMGLDSKLRQYVNEVTGNMKYSVSVGEKNIESVRLQLEHLEESLLELQNQEKQVMADTAALQQEAMQQHQARQQQEHTQDKTAHQQQQLERLLEDKEHASLQLQEQFQVKEEELQRALQAKQNELTNMISRNSSTQEAYNALQEEAKNFQSEKVRLKEEHVKHIAQLEQDFEARRSLIDERTELYKAETKRLQTVHQELQTHVNLEIKQRTEQLEREKQQLEQQLTEEMSTHNLQAQKDKIIKDSLQSEIEMFKKSCNQAHQDKEQILLKLKVAEAKYAELEAKLQSSQSPQKQNHNISKTPPSNKQHPSPRRQNSMRSQRPPDEDEDEQVDGFTYDTPVARVKPDVHDRRKSFQRADTPKPGGGGRVETPALQNRKALPRSESGENAKPNFFLSPDTALKKQGSKKNVSRESSQEKQPRQEVAENGTQNTLIGVAAVDDEKLQEMVQNKLTQNDIDDVIVLEELIKDREADLEQATAAKSRAKKKIKNWMGDFQKTNRRAPNQHEKEGVSDLYLNHQVLSEERDQLHETLEKMKATLNERVNKVVA